MTRQATKPVFTFFLVGEYAGEWKRIASCTSEEQAETAMQDVTDYRRAMGQPALKMMVV